MKGYTAEELATALRQVGVQEGDTIYLSTQLYGLGPLAGIKAKADFLQTIHATINEVIGVDGTLVVPTFTQQVGRFGLPYIHEKTECLTGIFSEFIRNLPSARRSLHPVFSVAAVGPQAERLTDDVSPVGFGRESAFDRLFRSGGKAVCIGFDYYSGHIAGLVHYVETAFAVPYYYNKYVKAEVWCGGDRVDRPFAINVKYQSAQVPFRFNRYIDELATAGAIAGCPLGEGMVYCVDIQHHVEVGFDLLRKDIYAFLAHPPRFETEAPPWDGPQGVWSGDAGAVNWSGFELSL